MVAPSSRFSAEAAERVQQLAAQHFPGTEILFHPSCFLSHNHFAGDDRARAQAVVDYGNDPSLDAVWFARGGYGACRIAEGLVAELGPQARAKSYVGYSDAGFLLAALYRAGFSHLAHGPMPQDVMRKGGEAAILRALSWLGDHCPAALEPTLERGKAHAAFNVTVLSQLLGTALEPDLSDHVLLLEEVAEHMYRTDRAMFHITGNPSMRRVAGIRLGRCNDVLPNDPDFGESEEQVVRYWCADSGIPYLGRCDIGHDADNRIVPFGRL